MTEKGLIKHEHLEVQMSLPWRWKLFDGEQEHMIVRGARLRSARFHMSLIEMCCECLTSWLIVLDEENYLLSLCLSFLGFILFWFCSLFYFFHSDDFYQKMYFQAWERIHTVFFKLWTYHILQIISVYTFQTGKAAWGK